MATGKLQFKLYTGEESTPVTDAEIIIIDKESGTPLIDGPVKLDINGKSPEIELYTYDKSLSLSPSTTAPYKTYDAVILSKNFKNQLIKNIPVFDGITSVQQVPMIPKTRGIGDAEVIDIPPNGLLQSKTPITNPKLPPQGKTPKLLDKPVIPKYITVHLGSP
ncbi:MAG: hypothetical protein ACRC68_08970, partial [Clostridium sp.]